MNHHHHQTDSNAVVRAARFVAVAILAVVVVILVRSAIPSLSAQEHHASHSLQNRATSNQMELMNVVRQSTVRFKDVAVAEQEGYQPQFGCVSGPDAGAMGIHYLKGEFVQNPPLTPTGDIDPTRPQIVIYEPTPGGGRRLIGADYVIIAAPWDKAHPGNPPQVKGQLYHYIESPNRFGLPAFYTLHVWAWKDNPNGAFVNWHPDLDCQSFTGTE